MRNYFALIVLVCVLPFVTTAQEKDRASVKISFNQLELAYKKSFQTNLLWAEAYMGLGNQDVNKAFDDYLAGLNLGYQLLNFKNSVISLSANIGFYIPTNEYFVAPTPVCGLNLEYEKFLGKSRIHSILFDAGFSYGRRNYSQEYENDALMVKTTDDFKVSPLHLSIGYGFSF